jgi:hypothetical protein
MGKVVVINGVLVTREESAAAIVASLVAEAEDAIKSLR